MPPAVFHLRLIVLGASARQTRALYCDVSYNTYDASDGLSAITQSITLESASLGTLCGAAIKRHVRIAPIDNADISRHKSAYGLARSLNARKYFSMDM